MRFKCCVGGCDATSDTHRLFSVPKNDSLRKLWMYFLVPTNPLLIGLSKEQLIRKRVCEKHFEKQQFRNRKLLRDSYPTLFTESEIKHGEPLSKDRPGQGDHTYSKDPETVDDIEDDNNCDEELVVLGNSGHTDHNYCGNSVAEDSGDTMLLIEKSVVEGPSCSSAKEIGLLEPLTTEMVVEEPSSSSKNNILHTSLVDTENVSTPPPTPSVMQTRIQKEKSEKKTILSDKRTGSILRKCVTKTRQFINKIKNKTTTSLGLSSSQRLDEAISCGREKYLLQNFEHLNKQTKAFLIMQLKNCIKNKMARRFSLEEKLLALTIMKQSPKAYKLLENMFALPNKRTLHRLSERVSLEPGCNIKIFQFIERKSKNWDVTEKLCIITFDEIALTPHLIYNEKKDIIYGFVDLDTRYMKFCDHALVFMLRGICSSWRQTIAYYFCEGTTPAATVQNLLKQIVKEVAQTGLIPLGLVCDQGSTFRTAIRIMRDDTVHMRNVKGIRDDGSVSIAGHDLSVFFDPPHLLKGLRNNFLTKDILWDKKIATWKDIQFIYDIDSKLGHTRALPKLTAQHVDPSKIKKMKVSIAAQVFSNRTAAMLKYTNALNILNSGPAEKNTLETTALVVEFVDQLFDSVNCHPGGARKGKLRKAVKKNSIHHKFWVEAIQKLKNIKFVDYKSKIAIQTGKCRLVRVPSLDGWITTLESFQRISKLLFEKFNVEYYYPRNINQDPLENFFGRVRALNFRNINPDANTFVYAYKSLLFSNLLSPHSKMANCEVDNGENIIDLNFLFEEEKFVKEYELPKNILSTLPTHMSTSQQPSGSSLRNEVISEKIKVQCSAYTAGFICRKMTKSIKCPNCLQTYVSSSENEDIHKYIKHREWNLLKNNNLLYPNEKLLILYRKTSTLIHNFLNNYCHEKNIKFNLISNINNNLQFPWLGCSSHAEIIKEVFIKNVVRLHIHNWCNIINKILKGAIEEKYVTKMDKIQKLALDKYKKNKLRQKVLNK